jgi:hypothetical protein
LLREVREALPRRHHATDPSRSLRGDLRR